MKDYDEDDVGRKVICILGEALQLQDDVESDHRNKQTHVEACKGKVTSIFSVRDFSFSKRDFWLRCTRFLISYFLLVVVKDYSEE